MQLLMEILLPLAIRSLQSTKSTALTEVILPFVLGVKSQLLNDRVDTVV